MRWRLPTNSAIGGESSGDFITATLSCASWYTSRPPLLSFLYDGTRAVWRRIISQDGAVHKIESRVGPALQNQGEGGIRIGPPTLKIGVMASPRLHCGQCHVWLTHSLLCCWS